MSSIRRSPERSTDVEARSMSGAVASLRSGRDAITGLVPAWVFGLLLLVAAIGFPYLIGSGSFLDASTQTLAYVIMALGLNIVVGFAGLLDLGYVAFYAIGAFVIGWFGSQQFPDVNGGKGIHILASDRATFQPKLSGGRLDIAGIHINFFIVIFIAMAITAMWGVLLGAPTLRLRGDYLAIVTLAFGEIVPRVFENSTSGLFGIGSTDFSHGRQGITPIDKINLPWSSDLLYSDANLRPAYWVALGMVVFTIFVNRRLRDSRLGRAWIAVREDEVAAASMGINLVRTKLWAYAIGAAFGGFAGVFLGTYNNTVNVDQFEFGFSVFILAMVIVGGMGNIWGVIVGAVALSMMNRYGLPQLNSLSEPLGFDVTAISFGIFGFFLLIMMVLRPEGLIPSGRRRLELRESEIEGPEDTGAVGDTSQMYEVRQ
jgi:branched-chain amino acid transport system permease protein